MNRLRVTGYIVQPILVIDDGEELNPIQVQPVTIAPSDWSGVVEKVAADIEALRPQIENEGG